MAPSPAKPTVAFVANTDWYLYNFRLDLIRAAENAGWRPLLICPPGNYASALTKLGYEVKTLDLSTAGINPFRELKTIYRLRRLLRREKAEILHLFTLKCVLYGCLASLGFRHSRPIAAVTGMGYLFTSKGWRVRLLKGPVTLLLRLALGPTGARIIFQNENDREEFIKLKLIRRGRTHVIRGSGVNCEYFAPPANTELTDRPAVLLFAARLLREKGIYEYIEATAALRAQGFEFISKIAGERYPGNPSSLTEAELLALKNEGQHKFLGHVNNMPEILAGTDIMVLPTYREGTPKSLLEAAAMARVIVTTDIPGCQGIVENGVNGFMVAPGDTASLIKGIRAALLCSQQERQTMGSAGREIAKRKFSNTAVNQATLAIYALS